MPLQVDAGRAEARQLKSTTARRETSLEEEAARWRRASEAVSGAAASVSCLAKRPRRRPGRPRRGGGPRSPEGSAGSAPPLGTLPRALDVPLSLVLSPPPFVCQAAIGLSCVNGGGAPSGEQPSPRLKPGEVQRGAGAAAEEKAAAAQEVVAALGQRCGAPPLRDARAKLDAQPHSRHPLRVRVQLCGVLG